MVASVVVAGAVGDARSLDLVLVKIPEEDVVSRWTGLVLAGQEALRVRCFGSCCEAGGGRLRVIIL